MIRTPNKSIADLTPTNNPVIQAMLASQQALSAQMQTVLNNMASNNTGTTTTAQNSQGNPQGGQQDKQQGGYRGRFRNAFEGICRQYKFWCWSCGVNLSHDSCNCRTQKQGHIKNATKDNPQGGNTSKDARYMMWRHPTTGAPVDHCVVI